MNDTIYRQKAIDTLADMQCKSDEDGYVWIIRSDAWARIDALPSAEPKKGRWTLNRSGAYCCSECMEPCATYVMMRPRDRFCKMCGARMEKEE